MKILIAAGGTGGHLYPAMHLGEELKQHDIFFAGFGLQTSSFFDQNQFAFKEIVSHPLGLKFIPYCLKGTYQALCLLFKIKPDVIVGFGSYHTFPVLLAAMLLRKKIILFEANAALGKVNRFFSFAAKTIAFQFPVSHRKQTLVSWLPWNKEKREKIPKNKALAFYGLPAEKKTALVFGGSQGAFFLNKIAPLVLAYCKNLQVIHITGGEVEEVKKLYFCSSTLAVVIPFEKKMQMAYSAADYVISRSGAGTIAELIHFELPSLLIPYPHAAENHQKKNGDFLVTKGGARLIEQKEASLEKMIEEFQFILENEKEMKQNLKKIKGDVRNDIISLFN